MKGPQRPRGHGVARIPEPEGRRPGMPGRNRTLILLAGLLVLTGFLALRVALPAPFLALQGAVFDAFQNLAPRAAPPAPVTVVDIDDQSLEQVGQWPWSRDTVADLILRLHDLGAAVIALDMVFAEPDRSSPSRLAGASWLADLGLEPGATALLPDHDARLAAALGQVNAVTGFGLIARPGSREPAIKAGFAVIGPDPVGGLFDFPGAVTNLPALEQAAAGNGSFSLVGRQGGVVRAMPLLAAYRGRLVPSLALEALRVAQRQESIALRTTLQSAEGLQSRPAMLARVGAFEVPLNREGEYWLHYRPRDRTDMVPAWKVLAGAGDLPVERIGGHIVLLGTSAVGLADLRATPVNPFEPGVNLHAQALEQILTGGHMLRPLWALAAELGVLAVASLVLLAVTATAGLVLAFLAFGGVVLGLAAGALHLFADHRLLLDPATPALGAVAVFAAAIVLRIALGERDRRRLRHAFAHYLSPEMVNALAEHPERLRLSGEQRRMTFLFTDLEGFTAFTERTPPEELVRILNSYLSQVCRTVMRHGGTIDKIVGDAVHVMFNAPLDQPDHADRAVACALEILEVTARLVEAERARGRTLGITRIGINTGPAVVGNFGGAGRFDYTAHGDAINTAARLEAANKHLGTRLCVSETTVRACDRFAFRPIGALLLKGKAASIEAFEPVVEESERTAAYRQAYARLVSGEGDGKAAMLAYARDYPDDPLGRLHADRIQRGEDGAIVVA